MSTRFVHTADWQLGKPFAGIADLQKRSLVQQERFEVLKRIGQSAREHQAEFILVAGDLFDSATPTKEVVAAACSAIGALQLPVLAIPGNHDAGSPGSVWHQRFFQTQCSALAPNLRVLLEPVPAEIGSAVVFPCPLLRRAESVDPTAWLRNIDASDERYAGKTRIVLAHGSTHDFGSETDDEEIGSAANQLSLASLPEAAFDYLALGDWHGTKQVGPKAWYSGTPERDRFPKGESNEPGNCLLVNLHRDVAPEVIKTATARFGWHDLAFDFVDDTGLQALRLRLDSLIAGRAREDLLRLELSGTLGIAATNLLEEYLEGLEARLLRIKLYNRTRVAPTEEEIQSLTLRASDPLIARVAHRLVIEAAGEGEEAAIARMALRELHAACLHN
ncbi:MAG TPA: DNA repair exonuclease [Candidatus Limnocylindria bacterium]|jgi:DNA repair exonuclease SbcCD nuclease subunit|nr:DNA repair exonuclease [Candidatus Limnocylindria bacterium]